MVLLWRDVVALEPQLTAAQADLELAQQALEEGDEAAARGAVTDARESVDDAQERSDGPAWAAAGWVPRYGASARAVRGGVDLAAATVELADQALDEALALVADGADGFVAAGGRIDVSRLAEAATALEQLPLAPVVDARDQLADLPASGLVGPTLAARDTAVARADTVITRLSRGQVGARTFASFLGAQGDRTYLVAVQNPAELRGTGGLFSEVTELSVVDGLVTIGRTGGDLVSDRITTGGQQTVGFDVDDPVERPQDFAERYDNNAGGAIIQSVNLDPDLPTVGPVLTRLYEQRTGRSVDGAILVDPFALQSFIGATGGPLQLPQVALAEAPDLPEQLTADNTAQTLLIDVYDAFGGTNPARDEFTDAVVAGVLQRLASGDWAPAPLARAMADSAAARRLQLWSRDADEQAGFDQLGIGGRLTRPSEVNDILAVTGVNAGPDKSDAHVAHRLTATIDLQARPGAAPWQTMRRNEVRVEVDNPLRPDDHDDYITGTNEPVPVGTSGSLRTRDALNRTWFQIWMPSSAAITALRDGVNDQVLRTGEIHDHDVIDYFLETPSASTAAFSAPYEGPLDLERVGGGGYLYELELWRQAKAIPDAWDVTVTPPAGLEITEVEVIGGGPPSTGIGPTQPQELTAVVEDGSARLTGTVTRDATLRVWLE